MIPQVEFECYACGHRGVYPIGAPCPACLKHEEDRPTPAKSVSTSKPIGESRSATAARRIGKTLRAARLEAGLTQETLAQRAGMSRVGLRNIEIGQSEPKASTLEAIARALDLSVAELIVGPESPQPKKWKLLPRTSNIHPSAWSCPVCDRLFLCLDPADEGGRESARQDAFACCSEKEVDQ